MRYLYLFLALVTGVAGVAAQVELRRQGTAVQLTVDGRPWTVLGGELGNSTASSAEAIREVMPRLRMMNLNTVLVPVYWDMTEPREGEYDFTLIDATLEAARANDLKVILLWFGAWKNSMSCYAPLWFKENYRKYPRAMTAQGKPLEIASVFSDDVYRADLRALQAWASHLAAADTAHTALMIQIENEIGMLENARDHSAAADRAYRAGVPRELTVHLRKHREELHPRLRERWESRGSRMEGSWEDVFGAGDETDEYFMAWYYANYAGRLGAEAKRLTGLPVYVNAALNSRGRRPGEYPSAGPLAHLKDIWHAAAPAIDMLSPDIYDSGFRGWTAQYHTADNPLFIPEIRREAANGAQAYYVLGEHDAIGISPFSVENSPTSPHYATTRGYAALRELQPLIAAHQGRGTMRGVYLDADSTELVIADEGLRITVSHYFTLPWDPRARDGSPWPAAGGVIIRLAPDEYIVAGTGLVVKFEDPAEVSAARALGEDGFAAAGGAAGAESRWQSKSRVGLGPVRAVRVEPDGSLTELRRYNGDETHQGRHVRIGVDDFETLHVKLYRYK